MASNPTPPDDDDWAPPERHSGRWENDDSAGAAATAATAGKDAQPGAGSSLRASATTLWNDPRGRPLILVSGLAVLGICALSCFILSLIVLSDRGGTLFEPAPGPDQPAAPPISEALVIRVNETPVPVAIPSRLNLGTSSFAVVPFTVKDRRWEYDASATDTAYWVPGTLVNYVIGLHASGENRQIVDALRPDDLITLDTSLGTQRYRVAEQATIRESDVGALAEQATPRLTLVMMGEGGGQRRVVLAQYTDESTPNELASVGSAINLGDVRVTALDQRLVPGRAAGLPAGKNYLQVDFQVTSLLTDTTKVLDAAQFFAELTDGIGTVYQVSLDGSSASGARGFSKGALPPGGTITATAGFEVPNSLQGPTLEWTFRSDKATPYVARVAIPYRPILAEPTIAPTRASVAEVRILAANISPDGNEVRIVGTVRNLTNQFLPASLQEITMSGPGGQFVPLNSALPAFPWNITAGETLAFQLSFARPQGAGPYVFSLFDQSFEISGL
jgi:hypothetical protein